MDLDRHDGRREAIHEDEIDHAPGGAVHGNLGDRTPSGVRPGNHRFDHRRLECIPDPGSGDRIEPHGQSSAEGVGQRHETARTRQLLAGLEARDRTLVNAGPAAQLGLRQARVLADGSVLGVQRSGEVAGEPGVSPGRGSGRHVGIGPGRAYGRLNRALPASMSEAHH